MEVTNKPSKGSQLFFSWIFNYTTENWRKYQNDGPGPWNMYLSPFNYDHVSVFLYILQAKFHGFLNTRKGQRLVPPLEAFVIGYTGTPFWVLFEHNKNPHPPKKQDNTPTSWWLVHQPIWKICASQKWVHVFPKYFGVKRKIIWVATTWPTDTVQPKDMKKHQLFGGSLTRLRRPRKIPIAWLGYLRC